MDIVRTDTGVGAQLALSGRLDTNTSPQLDEAVSAVFDSGVTDIVFEVADLEYVSSAGLRVIMATQKRVMAGGSLKLVGVHPDVMEVFQMTGFDKILTIE